MVSSEYAADKLKDWGKRKIKTEGLEEGRALKGGVSWQPEQHVRRG